MSKLPPEYLERKRRERAARKAKSPEGERARLAAARRAYRYAHPEIDKAAARKRYERKGPEIRAANKRYHQQAKMAGRAREQHYRLKYGITVEAVDAMHASQRGLCAACGNPPSRGKPTLHLDHDHRTGKVRALLCARCNLTLGKVDDSPDLLRRLAHYLERANDREVPCPAI